MSRAKSADGSDVGMGDLRVGSNVTLYGHTFHIIAADAFTRLFMAREGVDLAPDEVILSRVPVLVCRSVPVSAAHGTADVRTLSTADFQLLYTRSQVAISLSSSSLRDICDYCVRTGKKRILGCNSPAQMIPMEPELVQRQRPLLRLVAAMSWQLKRQPPKRQIHANSLRMTARFAILSVGFVAGCQC